MTNENHDPSTTEHESKRKTPETSSRGAGGLLPSRRRMLQAIGGVGASLAMTGHAASAGCDDDHDHHDDHDDAHTGDRKDGRDESAVTSEAYSRFSDQVTDGTYTVIDEINITTEEGGFASIHIARPEEGVADVGFINPENGEPQNAAATIIGYSEWLEPGLHENVEVPLFQDEELDAVSELDRLEEPTVLVSLAHIDSNENQEWDFFDESDEDPAYNGAAENTENQFAPPSARPTDIAAVVPLEENADEFEISR
ncbi:DUF7282 domain-containing protein [Halalkalicoccus ordinarius]|uniref:DUF7282 domain-containing protein n=1 Tax=Halalkalicoccus ordinarius TaxID=3116651 RepID=UPI00300E9469